MAKYKLIICDDAAIIRTNLLELIKSHFPDIDVVGSYSDGDEALAHLEQETVDLLIADIRMERIDGLQVAKYIFEKKLHTRVIIITGYQEFEYARKAVNYQVSALVTKPMDSSLLVGAITDATKTLDAFFTRTSDESQQKLRNHKQIAQALRLFIEGGVRLDLLGQDIQNTLLDDRCKGARLLNLMLTPDSRPVAPEIWDELVPRKAERYEIYVMSCRERGACCLVLDLAGDETLYQDISQAITDIRNAMGSRFQCALEAGVILLSDVSRSFSTELFSDFAVYLQGIPELNPERSKKRAGRIATNADIDTLRIILSLMLIYARSQVPALEIGGFAAELAHLAYQADAMRLMQRFNTALTDAVTSNEAFIGIVRKYIYGNIADESLSLEMVSRHFGYSSEHFSRKFKQMTGSTFQSYLADVRMERAKELLRDPKNSIAWVSARVGFKDPAYFSRVFKKHTGLLPKEFKNHITE